MLVLAGILTSIGSGCRDVYAQPALIEVKSFRDRVTDKAILRDDVVIWGMALSERPARLLVRTAGMKSATGDFYRNQILPRLANRPIPEKEELARRIQGVIQQLREAVPRELQRLGLLEEIHTRLTADAHGEPDLIIVEIPPSRLRSLDTQPPARRELCRLAMLNNIANVEELHWKSVVTQLQAIPESARKTGVPNEKPSAALDHDRIMAAVDCRLNAATRVIQNGDSVMDESAKPDLSLLVSSMLGGNVQNLLNELLNEGSVTRTNAAPATDALPQTAIRIASANEHSTLIVSNFDFDLASGSASVTRRLFRKSDDSLWKLVATARGSSNAAELKPGQVETIAEDPQVKKLSELVQGLGLGNDQVTTAVRMGAVVRAAMNNADLTFDDLIQGFITIKRLSQQSEPPVITLPPK